MAKVMLALLTLSVLCAVVLASPRRGRPFGKPQQDSQGEDDQGGSGSQGQNEQRSVIPQTRSCPTVDTTTASLNVVPLYCLLFGGTSLG